jgi:type IV pilus assembly protein PilO
MTLTELKNLDPKEVGQWPMAAKIGALAVVFLLIAFFGYWFDWKSELEALESAQNKETELRNTFLGKKKQAVNLDLYRQQLASIEHSFGALLKQLPNKSEMDALLTDINQAGLGRGLQFEFFKPAQQETLSDFYAELPISVKVSGNYHDLGAFASDIAQLSRIVTLNDLNINAGKDGGLMLDAVAKTFRYLDEEELAQQRNKAAKEKTEKAKGKK